MSDEPVFFRSWWDMSDLTLREISNLLETMPRIPKKELKCHPSVTAALRATDGPVPVMCGEHERYILGRDLLDIPIYEDEDLAVGSWFIYEDDRLVAFGVLKKT